MPVFKVFVSENCYEFPFSEYYVSVDVGESVDAFNRHIRHFNTAVHDIFISTKTSQTDPPVLVKLDAGDTITPSESAGNILWITQKNQGIGTQVSFTVVQHGIARRNYRIEVYGRLQHLVDL